MGADAFAYKDDLADTIGVHINLDSGGGWGRAMLNQLGPNNAWLAVAYQQGAPYPYGSVLVQDLVSESIFCNSFVFLKASMIHIRLLFLLRSSVFFVAIWDKL
jgi:hypothetical protein